MGKSGPTDKSFVICKQLVWEAYKRVKANKGAPGVDEQSIVVFESDLKGNLYKIWNRMSSGSYFPPPVRTVKIPKANGGERQLGIPTVNLFLEVPRPIGPHASQLAFVQFSQVLFDLFPEPSVGQACD